MIGASLGPYKILEQLGAGGMGEVYLGEDTRLGRKVAIKVLPAEFASDPERLARFEQEARAAAALNHPHIAVVHDVGSDAGEDGQTTHYMVQEYLEGRSLRDQLDQGALPLDTALRLAAEVGEALKAAHRAGIVHRDLKPDNVFVTEDEHAKVLDFGLAKLTEIAPAAAGEASMSPTMLGTVAGQVMGTAGYMAPEQAAGASDIDHRADMFAFGCVLYQMVTGRQPFAGRSVAETLAHIQHDEPPSIAESNPALPAELHRVIGKCLMKQPGRRYQHADDLIVDLQLLRGDVESGAATPAGETMAGAGATADGGAAGAAHRAGGLRYWIPYVATAAVTGAVVGLAVSNLGGTDEPVSPEPRLLSINLPADTPLEVETWRPAVVISPNGDRIVYVGNREGRSYIFVRDLARDEVTEVPGSEDGTGPFLSPDGESLGFFANNRLRITSLAGGVPTLHGQFSPVTRGASWGRNGNLALTTSNNSELRRLLIDGGEFPSDAFAQVRLRNNGGQPLTEIDPDAGVYSHRWPEYLPGGEAILFTVDTGPSFDTADIAVLSLTTGDIRTLIRGGTNAHYSPTGHIVFGRGGALLAAPFDVDTLEVTADPVTVLQGVMTEPGGATHFSLSRDGTLVYVPGGPVVPARRLVWVDRRGNAEPLPAEAREYMSPSLSPDGQQVAVTIREGSNYDIWLTDVRRGGLSPLTSHPGEDFGPVWTPDGEYVTFASEMAETSPTASWRRADAGADGEILIPSAEDSRTWGFPNSWSPDGNTLVLSTRRGNDANLEIWSPTGGEPTSFEASPGDQAAATFSPDGLWIAFSSDHSGRMEAYLKRADGEGGLVNVSIGGGAEPVWSRDGSEIFYRNGHKMMSVPVTGTGVDIELGTPGMLFEKRFLPTGPTHMRRNYDVAADGRFLMIQRETDLTPTELKVVLNFSEVLRRLVPGPVRQ